MKNNLVDELFDKSKTYRMGIFCTYGLNIEFLENYLLNLDGVANCSNICIFTDRKIYNKQFDVNAAAKPKWVNKRYLLIPIDTKGVFHPKLYLLASEKAVRIGIGSANLTREGIATNLEIASVFEVTKKDSTYLGLLLDCLKFLHELALFSESKSALECVNEFMDYIRDITISNGETGNDLYLIHNLKNTIIDQLGSKLNGYNVKSIKVISPFYDKQLSVHEELNTMYPKADFSLYIQQGKSNFPIKEYELASNTRVLVFKEQERYIHGKAIVFETDRGIFLLTGSSNYTASAMLSKISNANIETALWGKIDKAVLNNLLKPNAMKPVLLKNIKQLTVSPIEKEAAIDESKINDWLIEAVYKDEELHIYLKYKEAIEPKKIIINDESCLTYKYSEVISIKSLNKRDCAYVRVEGIDKNGNIYQSSNVWIINMDQNSSQYSKKRYYISDPSQLTAILNELLINGTEEELIDYLLRFNIPLNLTLFNMRGKGLSPMESKGNVFGEIISQKSAVLNYPGMYDAINNFLVSNYNKLCAHYDNTQLQKLSNFILIYGTIFSMMDTITDYIVSTHKKNPIKAADWSKMRDYFDLFLKYSIICFELLWLSDGKVLSFNDIVNSLIAEDEQEILGSVKSFKEYIIKSGNDYYFKQCFATAKKIYKWINIYIYKGKVITTKGTIVPPLISNNGIRDTYILKRKEIYRYIREVEKELCG